MFKLISCNVFQREACWAVAQAPQVIDLEFLELGEHANSVNLRAKIQAAIDAADAAHRYEAILLLFGVCGNATVGLRAGKTTLVMPRAHDCCTILLGSRKKFQQEFGSAPSTPFSSSGYFERGSYFLRTDDGLNTVVYGSALAEYEKKYGKENAQYIWETLHPKEAAGNTDHKAVFIDLPQTAHLRLAERFQEEATKAGKEYQRMEGDIRLIRDLIWGRWNTDDYLIVKPGEQVVGVYDFDEVVRAEGGGGKADEPVGGAK